MTVTPDFLNGAGSFYPGDLAAVGDSLLLAGWWSTSSAHMIAVIQEWSPPSSLTLVMQQDLGDSNTISGWSVGVAARADLSAVYFYANEIRTVTGVGSSSLYAPWAEHGGPLFYDRHGGRLLAVDGLDLWADDGTGTFSLLHSLPEGIINDVTVGGDGRIYAACTRGLGGPVCLSGSVWVLWPDGSASRPFITAYRTVRAIAYDPSTHTLAYLGDDWRLRRVPLP